MRGLQGGRQIERRKGKETEIRRGQEKNRRR
jgi:hypothetical protein